MSSLWLNDWIPSDDLSRTENISILLAPIIVGFCNLLKLTKL